MKDPSDLVNRKVYLDSNNIGSRSLRACRLPAHVHLPCACHNETEMLGLPMDCPNEAVARIVVKDTGNLLACADCYARIQRCAALLDLIRIPMEPI